MLTRLLFVIFLLPVIALHALEATFHSLETIETPQEITIRGFLLRAADGRWFLASEPNVKSCCMGAVDKAQTQILLSGNFDSKKINRVIVVQGTLHRDGVHYILQNTSWK